MVMHEVINTVAPRIAPTVDVKRLLEHGGAIMLVTEPKGFSIIEQRKRRIVWDIAIVTKFMRDGRQSRTHASASSRLGIPIPVAFSAKRFKGSMTSMLSLNAQFAIELRVEKVVGAARHSQ